MQPVRPTPSLWADETPPLRYHTPWYCLFPSRTVATASPTLRLRALQPSRGQARSGAAPSAGVAAFHRGWGGALPVTSPDGGAAGRSGGAWGGSERSCGVEPRGFLVPGRVGAAAGHGSPGRGEGGSTHHVVCSPPAGRHGVPAWVSHMAARSRCIVITAA